MVISVDAEKALSKIQHLFTTKLSAKLGTESNFLNLTKGIYKKPSANNILNDEIFGVFIH